MKKLYDGDIGRLVIVAAPGGSGKTSLLKDPATRLRLADLPSEIADIQAFGPNHRTINSLRKAPEAKFDDLCIHVDLIQPIRKITPLPESREKLLSAIAPRLFTQWQELVSYSARASVIDVVTLFVRREEHFRRWMQRTWEENSNAQLERVVVMVNGDSTNASELHRKVYQAWQGFLDTLSPRSSHIIDGNESRYRILPNADFESELHNGYRP